MKQENKRKNRGAFTLYPLIHRRFKKKVKGVNDRNKTIVGVALEWLIKQALVLSRYDKSEFHNKHCYASYQAMPTMITSIVSCDNKH